jgi:hypothetical protein
MTVLPSYWGQLLQAQGFQESSITQNWGVDYTAQVWGQMIPLSQGERAIVGAPLWAQDTQMDYTYSTAQVLSYNTADLSGSGLQLLTTVSYRRSFAVAFGYNLAPAAEHSTPRLVRLWINDVLVYDVTNGSVQASNHFGQVDFTFYPGSETQPVDATMAAVDGDLTPAYLGMIYIVIRNLNLGTTTTPPGFGIFNSASVDASAEQSAANTKAQAAALPKVRAEIIDGQLVTVTPIQYTLIDNANLPTSGAHVLPDWSRRQWTRLTDSTNTPLYQNHLLRFDTDSAVEISSVLISGTVNGNPVNSATNGGLFGQNYFQALDTVNNVQYSLLNGLFNNQTVVSFNATTGVVQGWCGTQGTFGPIDSGGGDPTVTKLDCVQFPFWHDGDIGYYADGSGSKKPIVAGAEAFNGWFTAVVPSSSGAMAATVPYDAIHRFVDGMSSVGFMDLTGLSTTQDPVAIVLSGKKIYAVLIHVDTASLRAHIISVSMIDDLGTINARGFCIDPSYGLTVFGEDGSGNGFAYHYSTSFSGDASSYFNATASGNGSFVGRAPIFTKVYGPLATHTGSGSSILWQGIRRSDTSRYEVGYAVSNDFYVFNLLNGTDVHYVPSPLPGLADFVWDEVGQQFIGTTNGGVACNVPIRISTNFVPDTIGTYCKWFSLLVGYPEANITIDPLLNDIVLGELAVQPFGHFDLMTQLGELYNFTFFESSGSIKFVKMARNPLAASATLLINIGGVFDGNTVQVGSQTYTFRTAAASAFEVFIGGGITASRDNLIAAANLTGVVGVNYAAGTTKNTSASASPVGTDQAKFTALTPGTAGNSITANRGGNMFWIPFGGGGTLFGGSDGAPADLNLTPDNMCAIGEGSAGVNEVLITTINEPTGGISKVDMQYWDINQDYAPNHAIANADAAISTAGAAAAGQLDLNIPFVLTEAEANARILRVQMQGPQATITQEMRLPMQFLLTEPVDVVSITIAPYNYLVKLDEVTINADWTISCSGINFSSRDDIPVTDMLNLQSPARLSTSGDSIPVVFDMPLVNPTINDISGKFALFDTVKSYGQAGFTVASLSETFGTATDVVAVVSDPIPAAKCATVFADTDHPWAVDESSIILAVPDATKYASAATYSDFLSGKNALIIGAAGRWELVFFRDVAALSSTSVQLTGLIRGMRGTEVNCGLHQPADEVYLVASVAVGFSVTGIQEYRDVADIGLACTYTSTGVPAVKAPGVLNLTYKGYSLYPFAPAAAHVNLSGSDVIITWHRRDRHSQELWVEQDPTMTEPVALQFKLEIMSGSTIVRTVTGLATETYTYLAASQTADGFTAPVKSLKFRLYQYGALGPGFYREWTRDVE